MPKAVKGTSSNRQLAGAAADAIEDHALVSTIYCHTRYHVVKTSFGWQHNVSKDVRDSSQTGRCCLTYNDQSLDQLKATNSTISIKVDQRHPTQLRTLLKFDVSAKEEKGSRAASHLRDICSSRLLLQVQVPSGECHQHQLNRQGMAMI